MEHDSDGDTNWSTWNNTQRIGKITGRLGNKKSGDHQDYSIINIGQNTEKSPEDLRKLAVTETSEENHQLTLVCKTLQGVIMKIYKSLRVFTSLLLYTSFFFFLRQLTLMIFSLESGWHQVSEKINNFHLLIRYCTVIFISMEFIQIFVLHHVSALKHLPSKVERHA